VAKKRVGWWCARGTPQKQKNGEGERLGVSVSVVASGWHVLKESEDNSGKVRHSINFRTCLGGEKRYY